MLNKLKVRGIHGMQNSMEGHEEVREDAAGSGTWVGTYDYH